MNRMVPRKAGQHARERFMYLVKITALLVGGVYAVGMITALIVRPRAWAFYAVTTPLVMVLFLYKFKKEEVKEIRRYVLAWRDGAIGEERVGTLLESLVPRGYKVLHDVDTGKGNLDHVVVGPNGVFVIETKAHRGRIYLGKGGRLMKNNYDVEKWVRQAQSEAFEVKECLARVGLDMWVEALIVLTKIKLKSPIPKKSVTVIEVEDLIEVILAKRGKSLSPNDISRAVASIYRGDQLVRVGA